MRRIDELNLDYPFAGSRMMRGCLVREGFYVGQLHVATLMKRMRIAAIYRRLVQLEAGSGSQDLLVSAAQAADHAAQLGLAIDIIYIPMARGFVYLAAVVD